ncbi:MAG: hypothetical protein HY660_09815 [Armatimonadetes bacterium]|nr:hypothetical protein [Armatimonadota bacterium]
MHPGFAITPQNMGPVAEICIRLQGVPLAIELAAARVKAFPPADIARRLEDQLTLLAGGPRNLPERHQTMCAAIAWSYELLCPAEQALFRRLTVLTGGCSLKAAEAVCADAGMRVLEGLASLVDKSLLAQGGQAGNTARFVMLESIREFGAGQLAAHGETERSRDGHTRYFAGLAGEAEAGMGTDEETHWAARLGHERDNLQAALEWSLQRDDVATGMCLATPIGMVNRFPLAASRMARRQAKTAGGSERAATPYIRTEKLTRPMLIPSRTPARRARSR